MVFVTLKGGKGYIKKGTIGVDENTALNCQGAFCTVLGEGGVWGIDVTQAVMNRGSMFGAMMFYIRNKDRLNLNTWQVDFDAGKEMIINRAETEPSKDIQNFDI